MLHAPPGAVALDRQRRAIVARDEADAVLQATVATAQQAPLGLDGGFLSSRLLDEFWTSLTDELDRELEEQVAAADQATALSPRTAEHRAQRSALSPNGEVVLPQAGARPERQRRPPSPPPPRPPPVMPSRRGVELVQPPSRLEVNLWSPRQQPRAQKHDRRVVRPPGAQAALDQLPAQAAMRPGSCRRGRHARSDAGCGGSYETEVTRVVRRYVPSNQQAARAAAAAVSPAR